MSTGQHDGLSSIRPVRLRMLHDYLDGLRLTDTRLVTRIQLTSILLVTSIRLAPNPYLRLFVGDHKM